MMKTELVEIFQTLRASLYSYQTRGYTVHTNSDEAYELFSEKNRTHQGKKITEFFFVGLYLKKDSVLVKFNSADLELSGKDLQNLKDGSTELKLASLDEQKEREVAAFVEILHCHFKKEDWV